LVVQAVQEKASVLVAQGTQDREATSVEKKKMRRRRRRGATPCVQELKTRAVRKKKRGIRVNCNFFPIKA
jgi:hypothetical protein